MSSMTPAEKSETKTAGSMVAVMRYMGYENTAQFRKEWATLSEADKTQLKAGIADGTLTY